MTNSKINAAPMEECSEYGGCQSEDAYTDSAWIDEVMENSHNFFVEDPTVTSLLRKYEARSYSGMDSYGMSMHDNPKDLTFWLSSLQEELMDASLYIERALDELNRSK